MLMRGRHGCACEGHILALTEREVVPVHSWSLFGSSEFLMGSCHLQVATCTSTLCLQRFPAACPLSERSCPGGPAQQPLLCETSPTIRILLMNDYNVIAALVAMSQPPTPGCSQPTHIMHDNAPCPLPRPMCVLVSSWHHWFNLSASERCALPSHAASACASCKLTPKCSQIKRAGEHPRTHLATAGATNT